MKKYILKSLFVSMLCMLAASCQDTNEFDQLDSSKAQVSFSIAMDSPLSRSRSTDNTWGGEYDNYVGDDYDNRIALDELVVKIEADGGKKYTLSNIIKWQAGAGNEYSFVGVIENLKSPVSLVNARISVYANMGRNADETTFAQDADCIPMWGMQFMESLTLTPAKRVPLPSISLLRAMAKIEVALNDEMKEDYTLTGATLDKVNLNGYPMPKSGVVNGTKTTTELGFEEGFNPLEGTKVSLPLIEGENGSWYIYLPEMMKVNNPKITVQLNDGDETGTFSVKRYVKDQEPQAMDIVRNHWYKYIISGFDANEVTVEYKTVDWKDKFIEIGGEGFLFLNKDLIEIYNGNISEGELKFSSSSPIKSIEKKDVYKHYRNGEIKETPAGEEADGVYAYYMDKYGVLTQLSNEEGSDEAAILENINATAESGLNGNITINSPFINHETLGDSHYNTIRYIEFLVTNEQNLTATFRVMQYPPVIVTNEEGYFSYRSDQKYSDDQEEASHFHNYQGWQSIHLSGLMFYHIHDWTEGYENTLGCCPSDPTRTEYKYYDYSWVGTDCGKPGLAPCEVVHYGNIGTPHSFVDSRGVEVSYVYGGLYRSTVGTADAFLRHRYYNLPGAQSTGKYKKGGYKISSKYYDHAQGDVQGLAIGHAYEENGRIYRKHYTCNVNPIFYNLYVDKVHQVATTDRKQGQADIHQMTHATTTYYGDEGTGWASWGRTGYINHRMYHIKTTVSTSEYVIGVVELIDKEGNTTNDVVNGVAANSSRNANIISPSFMVASQLGETNYQSIVNSAAQYPKQYIVPDAGNFYKLAVDHCREYVETTYKDLNNNYQWDEGEPVTHYNDWRLPTKAEINKIIDLQNASRAMDRLLVGQYYFCAAGAGDDADTSVKENWVSNEVDGYTSSKTGYYIRCVRDVKPEGQNGFIGK